jgi:hypothetical protein
MHETKVYIVLTEMEKSVCTKINIRRKM